MLSRPGSLAAPAFRHRLRTAAGGGGICPPRSRWRKFTHAEILARDKTSLDTFWLKDKSLADLDNLPDPKDLGEEIVENIEAGLANFRNVLAALGA